MKHNIDHKKYGSNGCQWAFVPLPFWCALLCLGKSGIRCCQLSTHSLFCCSAHELTADPFCWADSMRYFTVLDTLVRGCTFRLSTACLFLCPCSCFPFFIGESTPTAIPQSCARLGGKGSLWSFLQQGSVACSVTGSYYPFLRERNKPCWIFSCLLLVSLSRY